MLRKLAIATALLSLCSAAFADEQTDARAQCVTVAKVGASGADGSTTPEQQAQIDNLIGSLCGCVTAKLAALGDDGAKILHIIAKTTAEQAVAQGADPALDRKNTVAMLVADYGMSEADADAFYTRMDPVVKKLTDECQEEAMKSIAPAAP